MGHPPAIVAVVDLFAVTTQFTSGLTTQHALAHSVIVPVTTPIRGGLTQLQQHDEAADVLVTTPIKGGLTIVWLR